MKTSSGQGLFKVNAVTAGCLVALIATGVQAQQQQLDTIVVTGVTACACVHRGRHFGQEEQGQHRRVHLG